MEAITGWWDDFFWGSLVVVELFFVALFLTILFGLIGAGSKLSGNKTAKAIANGYTIIFRGTPEILVLLLFYFGSAITMTAIAQIFDPTIKFVDIPPFWAGSLAIALIIGSYATETFRGAFLGVDPGQIEASRALGVSNLQTFIYVRIPAMWRLALPPFGNHMLSLIKDTALVAIIGLEETLFVAEQAIGTTGKPFTMYILVGAIYLGFSTIITLSVMRLEKYANKHLEVTR
ncbi:MAG: ABC transporter permease subunit [Rhodospirillales bacterium]|nr:ABC transporter permease subunit [Rhodospirillales bacterium]MBT4039666.1 ABC transporter permease subunit [Rhodospirillales bacterium]MBT4626444.1 ABC transporter permease subunit [Rhodospirillales bacterium]MBT5350873.1 ABC transporter permease subunit [Rhodospirillales bacterium]MBT5520688.1 ABC transporter permease subunit [Rhodospirillales bacterium]